MQYTLATVLAVLAAPLALAMPAYTATAVERRAGGGVGQIISDHNKFVSNPATAKVAIPADENNAAREGHRQAHVALGPAGRLIPPIPV
ncbi:hypothetical protein HRG_004023 [Hirsutella rhossiliensis]|uniref:Uncharacterized protein n=1 Tax=Hirsutella rhossiliensis TaxID=111463 RepID=A0A9P8N3N4_9HYPO|nr:uncharacterized protein HRG_04023 [Hirsutella rhossiliensis]KAH0966007.1 hypothetical protein HRG_04023 [Hirsutella rhossiliensis]